MLWLVTEDNFQEASAVCTAQGLAVPDEVYGPLGSVRDGFIAVYETFEAHFVADYPHKVWVGYPRYWVYGRATWAYESFPPFDYQFFHGYPLDRNNECSIKETVAGKEIEFTLEPDVKRCAVSISEEYDNHEDGDSDTIYLPDNPYDRARFMKALQTACARMDDIQNRHPEFLFPVQNEEV